MVVAAVDSGGAHTGEPALRKDMIVFTAVGRRLARWRLDPLGRCFTESGSLSLPANIQYAGFHPTRALIYVASSDGGGRHGPPGSMHHITAVWAGAGTALREGGAVVVPSRPIHLSVDPAGHHVLAAFSQPAAIRAYKLDDDGMPTAETRPCQPFEAGNYPHQIRVVPDSATAISTALGQNAGPGRPEDPGGLNVFDYEQGRLCHVQLVAPNQGYGFGPRHLDLHPNGRWVYVVLERQNRLDTFALDRGRLSPEPLFSTPLLARLPVSGIKQIAGAIHVHPDGRHVYVVNRASDVVRRNGREVFAGGENTIAVLRIDAATGEPILIQHVETHGFHCRSFQIDASGKLLVAAHITGLNVEDGDGVRFVAPGMSVFGIGDDGRLEFDFAHPIRTHGENLFWMDIARPICF